MSYKILIINPGSTSTKIGVFEDENLLFEETLRHTTEELAGFNLIVEQKDFRKKVILDILAEKNFDIKTLDVCVGRIPSYIVDPVVVDELMPSSRLSGVPELPRRSVFHALNQKAVAKRYAKEHGKKYEDLNLIVVHMGGGVSVGAHLNGRIVDVNNALDGEGAFSPERAGGVPSGDLVKMCFSGKYTQQEVTKKLVGNGGFNAYIGSNDARDLEKLVQEGDEHAKLVQDAFHQQVAKDIGAMSTVLCGKVDQIILTGGIAYSKHTCAELEKRAGFIAPFTVYPGEDELLALAQGALRVMNGEEEPMTY